MGAFSFGNIPLMSKKTCNKCKVEKDLTDFHSDKRNQDGRQGQCKKCRNATITKWHKNNKGKTNAASARWRDKYPHKVKAYSAQYYTDNKEEMRAKFKAYMTPERNSYYMRLRRDRKRGAKGICTFAQLQARIDYYGGLCWICGDPMQAIDHVKPLAKGGTEWPANLRPICTSCNSKKRDLWPYSPTSRASSKSHLTHDLQKEPRLRGALLL